MKKDSKSMPLDVAIIGMAGQFPDAVNVDEFWANLSAGLESRHEMPADRWSLAQFYAPGSAQPGKTYSKWGSFLQGFEFFDATFFGISPEEARKMDPQHRLALQQAWLALEDSGLACAELSRQTVGVFAGARAGDYHTDALRNPEHVDPQTMMGADTSLLSAHIAHFLNLTGPVLTVNAACASAGLALHLACTSLLNGECDMALAGGAYVMSTPQRFVMHSQSTLLSQTGHCRAFDDGADGITLGEAVGFVVLKKLDRALEDRDPIHAVIKAIGVNHNGCGRSVTAPNPEAQARLLRKVLQKAGVAKESIGYIEAHGTGTRKGDACELAALSEVYRHECAIGSVKTNVGHAITASTVPSLFKVVLGLRHKTIFPSLNYKKMNQLIDQSGGGLFVNTSLREWPSLRGQPRRAAISCFAYTGTNLHMILEEAPEGRRKPAKARHYPVPLSAVTRDSVRRQAADLREYLVKTRVGDVQFADVAFTLACGRRHFDCRELFVAGSFDDLVRQLDEFLAKDGKGKRSIERPLLSKLDKAACRYHSGKTVSWDKFFDRKRQCILPLPGYAFTRERHQLERKPSQAPVTAGDALTIVLLSRRDAVALALRELVGASATVYLVKPDRHFRVLGNRIYQVNSNSPSDYITLFKAISQRGRGRVLAVNLLRHDCDTHDEAVPEEVRLLVDHAEVYHVVHGGSAPHFRDLPVHIVRLESRVLDPRALATRIWSEIQDSLALPISRAKQDSVVPADSERETEFRRILGDLPLDVPLDTVTIDSLTISQTTDRLNRTFGCNISPTLFFQCATLREIYNQIPAPLAALTTKSTRESVAALMHGSVPEAIRAPTRDPPAGIAIVGMHGVFPGSLDLAQFWRNLVEGRDLITEIPASRWKWQSVYGDVIEPGKTKVKWGGFLPQDPSHFDAAFFGISNREAELMDPQHRMFLEVVWHMIESSGHDPRELSGTRTGLFVGVATNDYAELFRNAGEAIEPHYFTGNMHSVLANRISYLLDLRGPSEPVDTACSSSLVAIHRAVESIRSGACDQAIAGGVNLILSPSLHVGFSKGGMLSSTGRCQTFDDAADGYVRGEGCAAIFLKRLDDAERDGDMIHAIIRGSAVNHGGAVRSLTVPNPKAQADLVAEAFRRAAVDPASVTFIETHGTGTSLGDPIEIEGLTQAFKDLYQDWNHPAPQRPYCVLGSVKTNIGHLEATAGIAGLVKVILAMRHMTIPRNLHFKELNRHIRLEGTPFKLALTSEPWTRSTTPAGESLPLRAGVSSFGFGGVNAHIVLEEHFQRPTPTLHSENRDELFVLSAHCTDALRSLAAQWIVFLDEQGDSLMLADAVYTLQVGRKPLRFRIATVVRDFQQLRATLLAYTRERGPYGLFEGEVEKPIHNDSVPTLLAQRKLQDLAHLWTKGAEIDWAQLYAGQPRRIALPLYPFQRARYWIGPEIRQDHIATEMEGLCSEFRGLEDYAARGLLNTFQLMGVLIQAGESYERQSLYESLKISHRYRRLFATLLNILERHDFVRPSGDRIITTARVEEQFDRRVEAPNYESYRNLLDSCLSKLPEILTGSVGHMQALFPNGEITLVEDVYRNNPVAHHLNQCLGEAIVRCVNVSKATRVGKVRILEIGAGTGSSSVPVWEQLRPYAAEIEYTYTDISSAFVTRAAERFGIENPFVSFETLDIQGEISKFKGRFDIVLAANVLHAARDMARVATNVRELLVENGRLFLVELTQATNFATLTFGLTDDWWSAEDSARRIPESPLLSRQGWSNLLMEHGFGELKELAGISEADPLGQSVFISEVHIVNSTQVAMQEDSLFERMRNLFHRVSRTPLEQLKPDVTYDRFGLDSLLGLQIMAGLEKEFGPLPQGLLYRENTLEKLSRYLLANNAGTSRREPEPKPSLANYTVVANKPIDILSIEAPSIVPPLKSLIDQAEGIAIIGLSGQYPQAEDLHEFWQNLIAGKDCVIEVPPSRWDYRDYPYHEDGVEITYPWGSFLEGIDQFDPLLFQISPNEARKMDPHERLFLKIAWMAFEDAGYSRDTFLRTEHNRVGVFAGVSYNNYQLLAAEQWALGKRSSFSSQIVSVANRVSYHFNLHGPSMPVDTACSSSLTAVHLACESLRTGECDAALAGGVNLSLHPSKYYYLLANHYLSPTGRCHSFGSEADGMVPGEGVGAVVLKRLSRALADGDHVYAVIKGTSCNHGGKVSGYTVPNPRAHSELIRATLNRSGVDPRTISYVEAHGTGTALGDPIEIMGLTDAYRATTPDNQFCSIGSVKSNLGHLEAAAGIAQLTKVLLQMKHKWLAPSIHCANLNPKIDFSTTPFYVQRASAEWHKPLIDEKEYKRRAAISSFGAGGVNAHVILEEYEHQESNAPCPNEPKLFVLSARSAENLRQYALRLCSHLDREPRAQLDRIAYTLQCGREAFSHRLAILAADRESLRDKLQSFASGNSSACASEPLSELGRSWMSGADVDWTKLYPDGRPRRIPLPGCPFVDGSYWIVGDEQLAPVSENQGSVAEKIAGIVGHILGIPKGEIDPNIGFAQLGMESVQAIAFKRRLEEHFELELNAAIAYQFPNLEAMTAHILSKLGIPGGKSAVDLDQLSEEGLSALLESELAELENVQ